MHVASCSGLAIVLGGLVAGGVAVAQEAGPAWPPPIPRVAPAPPDRPVTPKKVALGRRLFFDPRLSISGEVSCASCHALDESPRSGDDGRPTSTGVYGGMGRRNAPTVWNSGLRERLFWDGRAPSLEAQARGPLLDPLEMGMRSEAAVVARVESLPGYPEAFAQTFAAERGPAEGLTFDEIVEAIAAFERTLTTPDSPFDRFARGDEGAISPSARRGWELFQDQACIACHGKPTFAFREHFVRFPLRRVPELDFALQLTEDTGLGARTGRGRDDNVWRVPSLRNVAVTAPYFHNGSVESLEQAVRIMSRAQLGRPLSDQEVSDIVAFLESLTGERPTVSAPD